MYYKSNTYRDELKLKVTIFLKLKGDLRKKPQMLETAALRTLTYKNIVILLQFWK